MQTNEKYVLRWQTSNWDLRHWVEIDHFYKCTYLLTNQIKRNLWSRFSKPISNRRRDKNLLTNKIAHLNIISSPRIIFSNFFYLQMSDLTGWTFFTANCRVVGVKTLLDFQKNYALNFPSLSPKLKELTFDVTKLTSTY